MGYHLVTIDIGPKMGVCCAPFRVGAGSPTNKVSPGPRYLRGKQHLDPQQFGHDRHGPKSGGYCARFGGGAGSPSNTVWAGPKPIPSHILIHPTAWPQYTNATRYTHTHRQRQTHTVCYHMGRYNYAHRWSCEMISNSNCENRHAIL